MKTFQVFFVLDNMNAKQQSGNLSVILQLRFPQIYAWTQFVFRILEQNWALSFLAHKNMCHSFLVHPFNFYSYIHNFLSSAYILPSASQCSQSFLF